MKTFQKLKMQSQKKGAVRQFKKLLQKKIGPDLQEIKLYGSYAREQAGPYSDIDILILLTKVSEARKNKILDSKIEVFKKYDILVSPYIMSVKNYQAEKKIPTLFSQFVENEAVNM